MSEGKIFVKFNERAGMNTWSDGITEWRDGQVKELDEFYGNRLLNLYKSPFMKVEGMESPENRMIGKAETTKEGGSGGESGSGDSKDKEPAETDLDKAKELDGENKKTAKKQGRMFSKRNK